MLKPIKKLLQENLNELSKKELLLLPSSYQKIGNIVIVNLNKELWKYDRKIGRIILENIPDTKTVCRRTGFIIGRTRRPQVKVIAGEKNTGTVHKEHGISYKIDANKIMFSKGNLSERNRLTKLVGRNEVIVDMFAGIGYFSLPLAKYCQPKKVYAIEINPDAYRYLNENMKLNKVEDKVVPILGDCLIEVAKLGRIADRVLMGLLPSSKEYLMDAMKVIKKNGIMHYHGTAKENEWKQLFDDVKTAAELYGFEVELLKKTKVKSYAPKIYHWVLDCRIF
jgi:tRNA wybutosine-synthesizing protein 2